MGCHPGNQRFRGVPIQDQGPIAYVTPEQHNDMVERRNSIYRTLWIMVQSIILMNNPNASELTLADLSWIFHDDTLNISTMVSHPGNKGFRGVQVHNQDQSPLDFIIPQEHNETTPSQHSVAGLEHYAKHGYPQFQHTANFIRLVLDWWHVVNCKSRNANIITRDNARGAVISEECFAIQYLREFHHFLIDWNEGTSEKTRKLTAETMKALTFSTKSIISLALLLLNLPGVQYVLLGLINSDPIEKHYGRYRQQAGGDRDLGVLQVLQAEKTIRLKALSKFSGLQMTEICEVFEGTSKQQQEIISKTAKDLLALLCNGINDNLTQHSESQPVIFTCSGYLSWSLRKRISCESCLDLIVNKADGNETSVGFEPEPEQMETELMRTRDELWRSINKGGLVRPSDLMFMSCLLIYSLYDDIRSDHVVGKKLMECQNSRQVFKQMVVMRMTEGALSSQILDQKCQLGHSFEQYIPRIAFQFYTMFSKNLANEINSAIHLTRKRVTQDKKCNEAKKVKKLSSK
eukprot:TCALIF_13454-PA protein Name:"Protein of unknown function" AED:0.38 eAED:0.38 QI:0/0/0/0.33/1/1/3/0/517